MSMNRPHRIYDVELVERFTYHPPRDGQAEVYERVRAAGLEFARLLNSYVPISPELNRAVDSIDLAVMLANAAVARHWEMREIPIESDLL